jgi:hypothetical protein
VCGQLLRFNPAVDASADYELYLRIVRHFPIHGHAGTVAEYRLHAASMSSDASLMLASTMEVLRAQRPYVRRRRAYERAYAQGRHEWQSHYGEQLVSEIDERGLDSRTWREFGARVAVLACYYPWGLARYLGRRLLQGGGYPRARARPDPVRKPPPPVAEGGTGTTPRVETDLVS